MKLLTIEMVVNETIVREYMSLPIDKRARYIQDLFIKGDLDLRVDDFTTEMEGEF